MSVITGKLTSVEDIIGTSTNTDLCNVEIAEFWCNLTLECITGRSILFFDGRCGYSRKEWDNMKNGGSVDSCEDANDVQSIESMIAFFVDHGITALIAKEFGPTLLRIASGVQQSQYNGFNLFCVREIDGLRTGLKAILDSRTGMIRIRTNDGKMETISATLTSNQLNGYLNGTSNLFEMF